MHEDAVLPKPLLELANVDAGYGESLVLRGVSLEVAPSSAVTLIGPNGAGKSTLLRVAAGLLPLTSGARMLDGTDVRRLSSDATARRGVCLIPEGRGIFPSLTIRENISLFAPKLRGNSAFERAVAAFPELGARGNAIAGSLSGGQQQMVSLSRAFVSDPEIVLVDEASHGLAPIVVDRIYDAFRLLRSAGVALLVVEQYVERGLEFADRVYVLKQGQVIHSGPSSEMSNELLAAQYLGAAAELSESG